MCTGSRRQCRQEFLQFCSYLSRVPRSQKTSQRLPAKNTQRLLSLVSIRMASLSKLNRESRSFISPNFQKKFRNGFITTPRRPRHILPSKPLITRHIKSNRKKLNGCKRKPTQRTKPFSSNNRQPRIALTPCRPATTSFRSRRTICCLKSVRRSNPGRSTGRVSLCTTSQIHKSFGYHFSRAI